MPWYFPWPDYIKKKACRYLLQRYVGNFLEEKLTLDQLSVDIYSGTGTVKDVKLDVWVLNELLESCAAPVEIRDGSVGSISVEIPWSSLLTASSKVEIKGLQLTIQPKYRTEEPAQDGSGSISESMWSSLSSSMMLAQECLKQEPTEGEQEAGSSQPFDGPELLAQTIESVLMRVEVTLIDTVVRLEHVPQGSSTGIALEVHIERLRFFDEDAQEAIHRDQGSSVDPTLPPRFEPAAFLHKNLQMMGVTVRCEEFPEQQRQAAWMASSSTSSPSTSPSTVPRGGSSGEDAGLTSSSGSTLLEQSTYLHAASSPEMPPPHPREMSGVRGEGSSAFTADLLGSCLVGECTGKQELKVTVKQNEHVTGPRADVDVYLASVNFFLSPKQVHLLSELFSGFLSPATSDVATVRGHQPNKLMQPEDYQRIETDLQEHHQVETHRSQESRLLKESWGLQGSDNHDLDDDEEDEETFLHSLDEDMFFSMTGSMMSLSTFVHSNDMESSFTSSISSCSTDTSRTASSTSRLSYGSTLYRGPGASPMATAMPRGSVTRKHRHKKSYSDHLDNASEMTRYKIRFSSITATILHEDPSPPPVVQATTNPASASSSSTSLPSQGSTLGVGLMSGASREEVMSQRAKDFFLDLGKGGFRRKDQADWGERFEKACPYDHLRLIAAPFTLECECKSNSHWNVTLADVSVGSVDIQECLFSRRASSQLNRSASQMPPSAEHIQILSVSGESGAEGGYATKPCIRTKLKYAQKIRNQTSKRRRIVKPTMDISVELGVVSCEVDISLVDRLYTLLHPQPTFAYDASGQRTYHSMHANTSMNKQAFFKQALEDTPNGSDLQTNICVTCASAVAALRFPIPDLRGLSEVAWWKRSLRNEILLIELTEAEINSALRDSRAQQKIVAKAREIKASVKLKPDEKPIPFVKVSEGRPDNSCNSDRTFNWPRLLVVISPVAQPSVLEEDQGSMGSPGPTSMEGSFFTPEQTEPSPFSSKKVMYESEQMVMPGDQEEMREFMKKTTTDSRLAMELSIPRINVLLESRDFLEIIYNRFANDMLLWQPTAPTPRDHLDANKYPNYGGAGGLDLANQLAGRSMAERFGMCKSGLQYDSDSDDEEEPDSMQFFSVYDHNAFSMSSKHHRSKLTSAQNYLSLTLNISHGKVTIGMPVKNPDGTLNDEVHGECLLEVEDGCLFTVAGYKGDDNESYVSLQANRIALYHNGSVGHPFRESLESTRLTAPDHMQCCLYLSDDGVASATGGIVGKGGNSQHMVTLALKNSFDPVGNVKTAECSVAVRGATLRHHTCRPEHHWITQLGDFFDVIDETIQGYDMPGVVTQLHAHFWGCGLDYRPLYLPLKSFVLLESLSISSNLVYEAKESLLRFLIDDASLYISEKCNETKVNLRRDYISVVDLGMLELSLRLSTDKEKNPKMDLKVSNNVIHLRTCADSCTALTRLLLYLASDGDLATRTEPAPPKSGMKESAESVNEEEVSPKKPAGDSPVSHSHSDQMKQLMEEAMREINGGPTSPEHSPAGKDHTVHIPCVLKQDRDSGAEVFLFPDEDDGTDNDFEDDDDVEVLLNMTPPDSITIRTRVASSSSEGNRDSWSEPEMLFNDNEFCVLDDPGMGVLSRDGEPEVKVLDDDPIRIHQDHFTPPITRGDQLNAPLDFPTPTMRYTLQEMTLVWHIYGGHDLGSSASKKKLHRPDPRNSSPAYGGDKTRQQTGTGGSSPLRRKVDKPTHNVANMRWQERGGPGRDHSVLMELQLNKVRFRHETYPSDTKQSSRQILLVNDIEFRDRLAQSQINKFLYLYSSEARPKRTHANMVLVKALHFRPDPEVDTEECCLRVSLQPLRFNIDQDALFFLRDFFTEVSMEATQVPIPEFKASSAPVDKKSARVRIADAPPQIIPSQPRADPVPNGHEAEKRPVPQGPTPSSGSKTSAQPSPPTQPIFFKSFVFSPDVLIKLDYEGKRVDMDQGTFLGLLVGLGQLNHSELTLKRLHHRHGLLGIDRLILYAVNEWVQDIKKSQLPRVLGGVGPMHSFVQLFQGMVDLVRLPMEQYKRDGRLVRGFQRGANSFGTSTTMAVVELTNRFVKMLQVAAETAYDVVSPGPSVSSRAITYGPFGQQRLARQPADFREGMANAIEVVREGLGDTATTLMQTAMEEHEHKGVSGAVGGILRQIPSSVIRPLILATEATSSVLGGVRNQMLPDARKEDAEKWRSQAKR